MRVSPSQREGVRFMAECLTGQREFKGAGSILADDVCRIRIHNACIHIS
jgi:hypothetical protein